MGSFDLDHTGSLKCMTGTGVTGALQLAAGTGRVLVLERSRSFANAACPKLRLSSSGVRRGIIVFHVPIAHGDDLGDESDDADGEYFSTTSVHR